MPIAFDTISNRWSVAPEPLRLSWSPDQPRVPAGSSDGGEFAGGASDGDASRSPSKVFASTANEHYQAALLRREHVTPVGKAVGEVGAKAWKYLPKRSDIEAEASRLAGEREPMRAAMHRVAEKSVQQFRSEVGKEPTRANGMQHHERMNTIIAQHAANEPSLSGVSNHASMSRALMGVNYPGRPEVGSSPREAAEYQFGETNNKDAAARLGSFHGAVDRAISEHPMAAQLAPYRNAIVETLGGGHGVKREFGKDAFRSYHAANAIKAAEDATGFHGIDGANELYNKMTSGQRLTASDVREHKGEIGLSRFDPVRKLWLNRDDSRAKEMSLSRFDPSTGSWRILPSIPSHAPAMPRHRIMLSMEGPSERVELADMPRSFPVNVDGKMRAFPVAYFKKRAITARRYVHPTKGFSFEITPADVDDMARKFHLMRSGHRSSDCR